MNRANEKFINWSLVLNTRKISLNPRVKNFSVNTTMPQRKTPISRDEKKHVENDAIEILGFSSVCIEYYCL